MELGGKHFFASGFSFSCFSLFPSALRLWNFSCAMLTGSFIWSLLRGLLLCKGTGVYLSLPPPMGIWVVCVASVFSVVFLQCLLMTMVTGQPRAPWVALWGHSPSTHLTPGLQLHSFAGRWCQLIPHQPCLRVSVLHTLLHPRSCQVLQMLDLRVAEWHLRTHCGWNPVLMDNDTDYLYKCDLTL